MIVRNTETIEKYISINTSVEYDTLKPYIVQAERKHIKALIGAAQYAVFDEEDTIENGIVNNQILDSGPENANVLEAYNLAQEAICNFALYYALPILKTQITEAGIFTSQQESVATASDKDFKELQRSFKRTAHEALDELFIVMETYPDNFTEFITSDVYKIYASTLVNNTATFNKHYHIFNSRQTFMALKPEIETAQRQYLKAVIGKDLLTALQTKQTNDNRKEVKTLLQKSLVCFTIAKILENGLFRIEPAGISARFDVLPYEKITSVSSDHLKQSQLNKITEAEQILKDALEIITANPADFAEYTAPEESENASENIIVTKGLTML